MQLAAIGFRAKTGRAIVVVLAGTDEVPALVWRGEVSLADPKTPATAEPYHQVMEMPWSEATVAVQPLIKAIENRASAVLHEILDDMKSRQVKIRAVGVVGSPPRSLEKLGNLHIRAHAAEGILFRSVLESAAATSKLRCLGLSDRGIIVPPFMKEIGRAAGPPWRTDERLAATAAWLALSLK
jgi:hypothetical protein